MEFKIYGIPIVISRGLADDCIVFDGPNTHAVLFNVGRKERTAEEVMSNRIAVLKDDIDTAEGRLDIMREELANLERKTGWDGGHVLETTHLTRGNSDQSA